MSVALLAPAKINLMLRVLSKQNDGYHKIFTLMQTISLYDKLRISILPYDAIEVNCDNQDLSGKKNLCYRMAELAKEKFNLKQGLKIDIIKNIPVGGGLGGASSDAACVMKAILLLFNLRVKKNVILKLCSMVGKDVPFFLYQGLCIAESLGEKIKKLTTYPWHNKPLWFVVVYPKIVLPTKKVYQKYDELNNDKTKMINKDKIIKLIMNKEFDKLLVNDLESAAIELCPKLKNIKNIMLKYTKLVSMTGSGSCLFGITENYSSAVKLKQTIEKELKNCKIFVARSI
ncbi:MAG: 4-(cytidine 5'-diphospho)-2-C-methyl-D-erythritol kinase [Endomicrobia bacterium]|nr:4-(cytidine 5'-diphospho)-2-C-methyl-D-erythritol kinase [Endomicrobiia bacterium]MDW8056301.1 4-(cytidine 5'-diphospho)-2-C-methyl-D-erythritol kinase [Elusimicrobiota bacterium]